MGLADALGQIAGGEEFEPYQRVRAFVLRSTDLGETLSVLVAFAAEVGKKLGGDDWRSVLDKVALRAAVAP